MTRYNRFLEIPILRWFVNFINSLLTILSVIAKRHYILWDTIQLSWSRELEHETKLISCYPAINEAIEDINLDQIKYPITLFFDYYHKSSQFNSFNICTNCYSRGKNDKLSTPQCIGSLCVHAQSKS